MDTALAVQEGVREDRVTGAALDGARWPGHAMRDDPSVIALSPAWATATRRRGTSWWSRYVHRSVWSICVRYRLSRQDTDDVGQSVWLLLVEQIGKLRERRCPAGWRVRPNVNVCAFCGQCGGMTARTCPPAIRCRLTLPPR